VLRSSTTTALYEYEYEYKCGSGPYGPDARRPLTGPLCPLTKSKSQEPCPCNKGPDGPMTQFFDVFRVQKERTQINASVCRQSFTFAQNMAWGLFLCSAFPTQGTVTQSHNVEVSSESVMSGKQASNHPGLRPIKGQQSGPSGSTGARDQLSSLSLSAS
jgi:hypothetical protein